MGAEFDLMAAAAELTSSDEGGANDVATSDEAKSEGQSSESETPTKSDDVKTESAEEVLKQLAEEKESPEDAKALLEMISGLGAVHKGVPVSVESPAQLKELIQKGFDYTKKTMEHAESVKAKEAEFQKFESEFKQKETLLAQRESQLEAVQNENRIMESIVSKMQSEDPELFEHISKLYQREVSEYEKQKPLLAKFEKEVGDVKNQLQSMMGEKQKEELGKIKQGWEKELSETQDKFAGSLSKIGVKANWDKVKEAWASDSSGKMTVEQALYAIHGSEIVKANESYKKMLATKNKTQASILGRSGVGSVQKGASEPIKAKLGDYESILRQASEELT